MTRLEREFARLRAEAMRTPLTRASSPVTPSLELAGGTFMALSVNK